MRTEIIKVDGLEYEVAFHMEGGFFRGNREEPPEYPTAVIDWVKFEGTPIEIGPTFEEKLVDRIHHDEGFD